VAGSTSLVVTNGLVLNGTMYVGSTNDSGKTVSFAGSQTLGGNGTVVFGSGPNNSLNVLYAGTALTIGPGIVVRGQRGTIGNSSRAVEVINQGLIWAEVAGTSITIQAQPFRNLGLLRGAEGTVALRGVIPSDALGALEQSGAGQVLLLCMLDNTGKTFVLDGAANTLTLSSGGGAVRGGTVVTTNGAVLVGAGGTLDGVTLIGEVDLTANGAQLVVTNGLVLNGTMYVGSTNGLRGAVSFAGNQTLDGSGAVVFGNSSANALRLMYASTTLTLGPEIEVRGKSGSIGYSSSWGGPRDVGVINEGWVWAEVSGGTIRVEGRPFVNPGVLHSAAGVVEVKAKLGDLITFNAPPPDNADLAYQWRLNGVNIPDATNATFVIGSIQGTESGSYSVVIADEHQAITFQVAVLVIDVPPIPPADSFTNRVTLSGAAGIASGNNRNATQEIGEPVHAGKRGGKSVWYTWTAPDNGVAMFRTTGSAFDSLLGVYTGTEVTNLVTVADDDDGGGYLTSEVRFNAGAGTNYQIAVDGYAGIGGEFLVSWRLGAGTEKLPVILQQPVSQVVPTHTTVTFGVQASGAGLSFQWLFNDVALEGATNPLLLLPNVQPPAVGVYTVRVTGDGGLSVDSAPAALEISGESSDLSQDKLEDLVSGLKSRAKQSGPRQQQAEKMSVSLGTIGTQILHNYASTTQDGEPNHAGRIGGASRWFGLEVQESGVLVVDTIGSEVDTVLSVYTGTNISTLYRVNADDNGAPDAIRSLLRWDAQRANYLLAVDTVRGQTGVLHVNWQLGLRPLVTNGAVRCTNLQGQPFTVRAEVSNSVNVIYQWWRSNASGDTILSNETGAVLSIPAVSFNDSGTYVLVVSNVFGLTTNVQAWLQVKEPPELRGEVRWGEGEVSVCFPKATNRLVLEATTDFQEWWPVYTNDLPYTPIEYLVPQFSATPWRFYRVRLE
jgi:hypothetical protein